MVSYCSVASADSARHEAAGRKGELEGKEGRCGEGKEGTDATEHVPSLDPCSSVAVANVDDFISQSIGRGLLEHPVSQKLASRLAEWLSNMDSLTLAEAKFLNSSKDSMSR